MTGVMRVTWPVDEDDEAADTLLAALRRSAYGVAGCEQSTDALARIAEGAAAVIPGVLDAGITVRGPDGFLCAAHTTETAAAVDRAAIRLAEGPCIDAVAGADTVLLPDVAAETRWPRFVREAARHGVRASLSVPFCSTWPAGALNLHVTRHALHDESLRRRIRREARIFAVYASVALAGAHRVEHLERALRRRDVIGQAKGILMAQHGIDADEAFERLRRASQTTNIKLHDIAAWLAARDSTVR